MSVSIIIPVHNHRLYLRECVESIVGEEVSDLEIIVIDDASSDGSLGSIDHLPVKKIRLDKNIGPAAARNVGLKVASGQMIAFFDSDDVLEKNGLKFRVDWLKQHPEWSAVQGSVFSYIDSSGQVKNFEPDLRSLNRRLPEVLTWDSWKAGFSVPIPLPSCLFRKSVVDETGGFDEGLRYAEDLDFFYRFLRRHDLPHLFQPVMRYRIHGKNTSTERRESQLSGRPRAEAARFLVDSAHGIRRID